ncbi:hypothetical protein [Bacillus thuringiensis]|uniref:hypothetical protein n=1 Tax=Bacillus thuringiensis TaxID=1428 RepID=UPI003459C95C
MSKPARLFYIVFIMVFTVSAMKNFQDGKTASAVIDCLLLFANTTCLTFFGGDR